MAIVDSPLCLASHTLAMGVLCLGSSDPDFPHERVGSGDETNVPLALIRPQTPPSHVSRQEARAGMGTRLLIHVWERDVID